MHTNRSSVSHQQSKPGDRCIATHTPLPTTIEHEREQATEWRDRFKAICLCKNMEALGLPSFIAQVHTYQSITNTHDNGAAPVMSAHDGLSALSLFHRCTHINVLSYTYRYTHHTLSFSLTRINIHTAPLPQCNGKPILLKHTANYFKGPGYAEIDINMHKYVRASVSVCESRVLYAS